MAEANVTGFRFDAESAEERRAIAELGIDSHGSALHATVPPVDVE